MMETKKVVPVEPLTAEAREEQLYALVGRKVRMMLSGGVWDLKGSPVSFMQNRKNLIADIDDALAQSRPAKETAAQQEVCGAPAVGGTCGLPAGHNIGKVDIPQNHKAAAAPMLTDEKLNRLCEVIAECVRVGVLHPDFNKLAAQAKLANRGLDIGTPLYLRGGENEADQTVAALRAEVERLTKENKFLNAENLELEATQQACKSAERRLAVAVGALEEIREVWAGAEIGESVHAQEAYTIRLCKQMYQAAVRALREVK